MNNDKIQLKWIIATAVIGLVLGSILTPILQPIGRIISDIVSPPSEIIIGFTDNPTATYELGMYITGVNTTVELKNTRPDNVEIELNIGNLYKTKENLQAYRTTKIGPIFIPKPSTDREEYDVKVTDFKGKNYSRKLNILVKPWTHYMWLSTNAGGIVKNERVNAKVMILNNGVETNHSVIFELWKILNSSNSSTDEIKDGNSVTVNVPPNQWVNASYTFMPSEPGIYFIRTYVIKELDYEKDLSYPPAKRWLLSDEHVDAFFRVVG